MIDGLALLIWLAWSICWALVLRLSIAAAARRYLGASKNRASVLAYAAMAIIFVGSAALHGAVLGPPNLYGATPQQAFSLVAYALAPFGFPLLIGGLAVIILEMVLDLLSCCVSLIQQRTR